MSDAQRESRDGHPFTFTCRRSGNCCAIPGGFVRVTADDIVNIAAHLGMSVEAFTTRYVQPSGDRLRDGLANRCVFLADGRTASCSIYDVRPRKCREWPFWPELRDDAELLKLVMRTCPGIEATGTGA